MHALIRLVEERDVDGLFALFDEVAAEGRWIGTEPGYDRALYRSRWLENARDPLNAHHVAEADGRIVGHVDVFQHEDGPMLGMLVAKDFRRVGLGRALLQTEIDWARRNDLTELNLLVFPHNDAAIALYRVFGFTERARYERDVTRQNGEVWDTILMTKSLEE